MKTLVIDESAELLKTWPTDDLESVDKCPACGGIGRDYLTNLTDIVFKCAAGTWTMKQCQNCESGFLDPRPTSQSIHRAYDVYYTHGAGDMGKEAKFLPKVGVLRRAINGRLNLRYGLNRHPASSPLGLLLNSVPFIGSAFDPLGRSLHKPPHPGATLLDMGCGDGRFLIFAKEMGWNVVGIDFDEKAVAAARTLGLDVRLGSFDALRVEETFDAITMSHVIEHVHNPLETMQKCFDRLRDGGVLTVETPNFEAYGRNRFGAYWRGLEVPRHLTIFSEKSLRNCLQSCGFSQVKCVSRNFVSITMHLDSNALQKNQNMNRKSLREMFTTGAVWDGIKGIFSSRRREFLKFIAIKQKKPKP